MWITFPKRGLAFGTGRQKVMSIDVYFCETRVHMSVTVS